MVPDINYCLFITYVQYIYYYQQMDLSAMTSKIKMAVIVWGLCMEGLWRGWRVAMMGMKKL